MKMELLCRLWFLIVLFTSAHSVYATKVCCDVTKPPEEDSTKYPILIPKNDDNDTSFDWEGSFRNCGMPMDGCPAEPVSAQVSNGTNVAAKPSKNFTASPHFCRCDENCTKYGDCCVTILKRIKQIPNKEITWRCVKLLDSTYSVRMISKCHSDYPVDLNKELCETAMCPSKELNPNAVPFCPLLDVPVVNNKTQDIYRSIFCARCNFVSNKEIYETTHEILCSNFSSKSEWEEFKKRAVYQQGELHWSDPNNPSHRCALHVHELQPTNITKFLPGVRFCPNPTDVKEDCALDLSSEENRTMASLCASYMQVVDIGADVQRYKNPHCAKCEHPDIDIRKSPVCLRDRLRTMTKFKIERKETANVGINILFHFSIDDGYVGYTSKCEEDEILDFIRNKCIKMICPKGYELSDGQCEKIEIDSADSTNSTDYDSANLTADDDTSVLANSSEPCFLIILNAGEYHILPNGSLVVNQSDSSAVIFHPDEFQRYNGSSMSICAREEETYQDSFAPALSTLSNVLLALSVLFSLLHVILYMILPKMRNLPGNNLLCLTASLLISQFIFLTMINATSRVLCVAASITMHYFFLASFFWMNIMSFDIWRTFSSEFLVRRYSGDIFKTFIKYSLFAWITPLLIVVLAVLTDFALSDALMDWEYWPVFKKFRPLYGYNNLCWITQKLSLTVFFAFPVALIILCNLILFTLTAYTILLQHREGNRYINGNNNTNNGNKVRLGLAPKLQTANGKSEQPGNNKLPLRGCNSGSTKKSDEIRLKLYAKLALIMGLTWILGFLSAFTEWEWLWYIFVIFNGLQGTFIFIAFDCKAKVWHMLKEEFSRKKKSKEGCITDEGSSSDNKRRGMTSTTTMSTSLEITPRDKSSGSSILQAT